MLSATFYKCKKFIFWALLLMIMKYLACVNFKQGSFAGD